VPSLDPRGYSRGLHFRELEQNRSVDLSLDGPPKHFDRSDAHSPLMFAARIIGVQRAISLFTRLPSACRPRFVLSGTSPPSSSRRLRVFAQSVDLLDAALRLAATDRRLLFDKASVLLNWGSLLADDHQVPAASEVLSECHKTYARLARKGPLPPPHDQIYPMLKEMFS
jgi:hypothetical protein